ncbi:STAS domain-containing protein [Mycolicibacterium thermoresistibile]|uniref:STAS domain-containing protein n=1 Tax=Mycolicibacterium thermoresistibile TaxID=1797 RepID=UPI002E256F1E
MMTLVGDLRLDRSEHLHRMVAEQLGAAPSLLAVDFTDVGWVDPAALVSLASCGAMAAESRVAFGVIDGPGGPMRTVLERAGLAEILPVFDSLGEALGAQLSHRVN